MSNKARTLLMAMMLLDGMGGGEYMSMAMDGTMDSLFDDELKTPEQDDETEDEDGKTT